MLAFTLDALGPTARPATEGTAMRQAISWLVDFMYPACVIEGERSSQWDE